MSKNNKKFYAYLVNGKSGVVDNWPECQKLVSGKDGAKFKGFAGKEEAELWLDAGAKYGMKHLAIKDGIYFDSGTGAGEGVEISVTDKNGKSLLNKVLQKEKINNRGFCLLERSATNNFGELLALKYALEIALKDPWLGLGQVKNIFGDSKLVIDFWSKGYIKKDNLPEETVELSSEVKKLRYEFEKNGGKIELISGASNPADLGFHR
jgi:ribonuclease HI